jgi:hypothetical protein
MFVEFNIQTQIMLLLHFSVLVKLPPLRPKIYIKES